MHHQLPLSSIILVPSLHTTLQANPKSSPWHARLRCDRALPLQLHMQLSVHPKSRKDNLGKRQPPTKKIPKRGQVFPRKTPSIRKQGLLPLRKHPLAIPAATRSQLMSLCHFPIVAASDRRVHSQVPAAAVQGKRLSHPRIAHPGSRRNSPSAPSPMTAGTGDGEHAGLRAFQAWPLRITRGQPKITACLVTLRGQAGSGLPRASLL